MINSKIKGFLYPGNAVHGEPDYGLADNFVRNAEAFAKTTYQSVYIIAYFRKNFLYVSPNPLFLCRMSADAVKSEGYQFYIDHVPADELNMLFEINKTGFSFINDVPLEEKRKYTISYDFHLVSGRSVHFCVQGGCRYMDKFVFEFLSDNFETDKYQYLR